MSEQHHDAARLQHVKQVRAFRDLLLILSAAFAFSALLCSLSAGTVAVFLTCSFFVLSLVILFFSEVVCRYVQGLGSPRR